MLDDNGFLFLVIAVAVVVVAVAVAVAVAIVRNTCSTALKCITAY